MLQIKNVSKKYGDVVAVNNVSLNIEKGEIVAVVGPNGAGKTTLIEMIMGLKKPTSGKIYVDDREIKISDSGSKEDLGVLLQNGSFYPKLKVRELLDLYGSYYSKTMDVDELISLLKLQPVLNKSYGKLSGGWKQRAGLALAFLNDPKLILLDEPTTGLDPEARMILWNTIRTLKNDEKTVLVSTHYMEEVSDYCTRVAVIANGKLMDFDSPENLVAKLDRPNARMDDVFFYYASHSPSDQGVMS